MVILASYSALDAINQVVWAPVDHFVSGGTSDEDTVGDSVFEVTSSATVDHNAQIIGTDDQPLLGFASQTPDIATVSDTGYVTRVSDGIAKITVKTRYGTVLVNVPVSREVTTFTQWLRFVEGSLARHMYDQIVSRLADLDPVVAKPIYTTFPNRNALNWSNYGTTPLDITCIAQSNRNGTLITPWHVIFAEHHSPSIGATIRFSDNAGTIINRTVADRRVTSQMGSTMADLCVVRLNDAVPESIIPAQFFPANYQDYLPSTRQFSWDTANGPPYGVPLCSTDGQRKLLTNALFYVNQFGIGTYNWTVFPYIHLPVDIEPFFEQPTGGDSSSGIFACIHDRLVIAASFTGQTGGANYGRDSADIQNFIDDMDHASPIGFVDLSEFPNYGA